MHPALLEYKRGGKKPTDTPGAPQTMQRPPKDPKLHSSQIRTIAAGRTYESQMGLF